MKKIILTSAAVILATSAAQAVGIKPYISNKLSYSFLNQTDSASIYWNVDDGRLETQFFHNEMDGVLGNKLAVGVAFPIDAIHGAIRTELEWGINTKAKIKNESYKSKKEQFGVVTWEGWAPAIEDFEIKTSTYFFNAYYDFNTGTAWTPYIGIGAGLATLDLKSNYLSLWGAPMPHSWGDTVIGKGNANNFAWNIGLGIAFAIDDNFAIDLGYRYARLGDVKANVMGYFGGTPNPGWGDDGEWGQYSKATVSMHDIMLGVRYAF